MNIQQKLAYKLNRYVGRINPVQTRIDEESVISATHREKLSAATDSLCFSRNENDCRKVPALPPQEIQPFNAKETRNGLISVLYPEFSSEIAETLYDIRALCEFQHIRCAIPRTEEELLCQLLHKYEPELETALLREARFGQSRAHPEEKQAAQIAKLIENYRQEPTGPVKSSLAGAPAQALASAAQKNAQIRAELAKERRANEQLEMQRNALLKRINAVQQEKTKKLSQNDALEALYFNLRIRTK